MPVTRPRRPRTIPSARYFELVRLFPLVPIANDRHLGEATDAMHRLTPGEAAGTLAADERAYLEVLVGLVAAYEDGRHAVADLGPADLVAGLLDARGWTQAEFARATGVSKSTVNAVVRGRRGFTAAQATALGAFFRRSPAAFLPAATPAAAGR